ncbi:MAG: 3-hydroxyacyl-ACP dehydratase FabZ family protein [Phycisphaerae bacterium]
MKFELIDRIVELEAGKRVKAVKAVSLSEEYLADHFPTFPVLPGVFMLEAMVEAAAWLVRVSLDFRVSVILLANAKNVTYKSFVKPGNLLELDIACRSLSDTESVFSGSGTCAGAEMVKARFTLRHGSVASFHRSSPHVLSPNDGGATAGGVDGAGEPANAVDAADVIGSLSDLDRKLIDHAKQRLTLLHA